MRREIEILAPAGSAESLKAAIHAGADAVYIGGTKFGARAYADNLTEEDLLKAIDYVHLHGKKMYLTVNTLLKEREMKTELYQYLLPYYKRGLDAVIVQDAGVLKFVKEFFPDLPIHASTQMTLTGLSGARLLEEYGVERVVTARELNLKEIREISEGTDLEIESFVHGALCYCYSGQCLYSSVIGGRSGNRGQCAQPCRLPYKMKGAKNTAYLMSLKDICTVEYIPEMIEAGIHSFKIEGRMKKPEYVAAVVSIYRKYVDLYRKNGREGYRVEADDIRILQDIYNRGGFYGGYYKTRNGREMLSLERPNHAGVNAVRVLMQQGRSVEGKALVDLNKGDIIELPGGKETYTLGQSVKRGGKIKLAVPAKLRMKNGEVLCRTKNEALLEQIRKEIIEPKRKEKINGKLILSAKEFATLSLECGDIKITVQGDKAETALNQPMDAARIEKQMRKTGNTEFVFDKLDVQLDGDLFVPMQALNDLRRRGIEALEEAILSSYRRNCEVPFEWEEEKAVADTERLFYVCVENMTQFAAAVSSPYVKRIYADSSCFRPMRDGTWKTAVKNCGGKEVFLALPHIFRADTQKRYESYMKEGLDEIFDGYLVRNYESIWFLKEMQNAKPVVIDHNLYQFNHYSRAFFKELGHEEYTAPLELNYRELEELGMAQNELTVYGRIPMMVSAQCIQKTTDRCTKTPGRLFFTDRIGKTFPVCNYCEECYNIIYNAEPTILLDQLEEVERLSPKAMRLHFTLESASEMNEIMERYWRGFREHQEVRMPEEGFTRGHFKRGIK